MSYVRCSDCRTPTSCDSAEVCAHDDYMPEGHSLGSVTSRRPSEADVKYWLEELEPRLAEMTDWEQGFVPDMLDIHAVSRGAINRFTDNQLNAIERLYRKYCE